MHLEIRRELLKDLLKQKGWTKAEFARKADLNYSYLHRLLKGERKPGSKFFSGFLKICKEEGLTFEDYVYIKANNKNG